MKPRQLSTKIKRLFGESPNIYDVIDHYNIILTEVDTREFIAGYRLIKRWKVIQVSRNLDENMKRCVLWHELGHALMHRTVNCYYMANKTRLRTMQYEVEAEQFAADMLLPDQLDPELEGRTVQEIAAYYGVTENLIEARWRKQHE